MPLTATCEGLHKQAVISGELNALCGQNGLHRAFLRPNDEGDEETMYILRYMKTARMAMLGQTNGGLLYLIPGILLKLFHLVPLMFLWRTVLADGVDAGMSMGQMMTYTYLSALLSDMLAVSTVATLWCYEGQLLDLFLRPMGIFGHLVVQTAGGWVPMLLSFSLPMAAIAPFLGISMVPASAWFFPSLLLCVSLGFAIDFLFACLMIRLKNSNWLIHVIRNAVTALFSGSLIPFSLLPFGLGPILALQPFGSLGGAPLSIFAGIAGPGRVVLLQLFWNAVLWPAAVLAFGKSQERLMSYGG